MIASALSHTEAASDTVDVSSDCELSSDEDDVSSPDDSEPEVFVSLSESAFSSARTVTGDAETVIIVASAIVIARITFSFLVVFLMF
jgi:hypothetical protein